MDDDGCSGFNTSKRGDRASLGVRNEAATFASCLSRRTWLLMLDPPLSECNCFGSSRASVLVGWDLSTTRIR